MAIPIPPDAPELGGMIAVLRRVKEKLDDVNVMDPRMQRLLGYVHDLLRFWKEGWRVDDEERLVLTQIRDLLHKQTAQIRDFLNTISEVLNEEPGRTVQNRMSRDLRF